MTKKIKAGDFLRALVCILVTDARRRGYYCDLYLGNIKLPNCNLQSLATKVKNDD